MVRQLPDLVWSLSQWVTSGTQRKSFRPFTAVWTPLLCPLLPLPTQVWDLGGRKLVSSSSKPQRAHWRNKVPWGWGEAVKAAPLGCGNSPALGAQFCCKTPGSRTGEGQRRTEGAGPGWGRLAWKALSLRPWARVESMCVSSFGRWLLASQACLLSRPQLPSPLAGCLWVSPVSQDCLRDEGRTPQVRCAGIDVLNEVNADLEGG